MLKFFICGPPRSGTSTIHYAMLRAGLYSGHGSMTEAALPFAIDLHRAFVEDQDPLLYLPHGVEAIADCHVTRSPKLELVSYWPTFYPRFLPEVRKHHPKAWIILNTRATDLWLSSVKRWKDLHARICKASLPFLPAGMGSEDEHLVRWINGYYERTRISFQNDDRFIEFDISHGDPRKMLSERTGVSFPWWGIKNANPERTQHF